MEKGRQTDRVQGSQDVAVRFCFVSCAVCGVGFALPMALYLERVSTGAAIYCPNGHEHKATVDQDSPAGSRGHLLSELQQVRFDNLQLQRDLARYAVSPPPLDAKELKRRAGILSAHAEGVGIGGVICVLCGNEKRGRSALRNHLIRQHAEDLKLEPASRFE